MKTAMTGALLAAVLLTPLGAAELPGKAVFDETCKNCHGPEAQGSQTADDFYKLRIPRLTETKVQLMTNAEIKTVIVGGKDRMEPVRKGRPVAPHRQKLTDKEVDDVVAYVRFLGKSTSTK